MLYWNDLIQYIKKGLMSKSVKKCQNCQKCLIYFKIVK